MTLSQALVGETIPPRERARYQGYLAAVAVCANTLRPGRRRLSDRAFRLAVDLPGQCADRARRGGADLAAAQPEVRAAAVARRPGRACSVHDLCGHDAAGARTGPACRIAAPAGWRRVICRRRDRAGAAGAPREPRRVAAYPAGAAAPAGDLAQRRARRLPRRGAGLSDYVSPDLSRSGARALRHRTLACCWCR